MSDGDASGVGQLLGGGEGVAEASVGVDVGQVGEGEDVVGSLLGLGALVVGSGFGALVVGSGLGVCCGADDGDTEGESEGDDDGSADGPDDAAGTAGPEVAGCADVSETGPTSPPDPAAPGGSSTSGAAGGSATTTGLSVPGGGTTTVPGGSGVPGGIARASPGTIRTTVPPSTPRSLPLAGPRVPNFGPRTTVWPVA